MARDYKPGEKIYAWHVNQVTPDDGEIIVGGPGAPVRRLISEFDNANAASPDDVSALATTVTSVHGDVSVLKSRVDVAINENGTIKDEAVQAPVAAAVDANPTIAEHDTRIERIRGRHELALFDDFTVRANGPLNGVMPQVGPAWGATGSEPPAVSGGAAYSTGNGYLYATFPDPVQYIEATLVFTGSTSDMTISWAGTPFDLGELLHFQFLPTGGMLTVRQDSGAFDILLEPTWAYPCRTDGVTRYRVAMWVKGEAVSIIGPHGELYRATNPRIAEVTASPTVFWQPRGASPAKLLGARALRHGDGDVVADTLPSFLDAVIGVDPLGRTYGNANQFLETSVGGTSDGMPGVTFGPSKITTRLASPVVIGATTITTEQPFGPSATVQLGGGDGAETVTTTGLPSPLPGAGSPYVHTLTAPTTKAHSAGSAAVASGYTQARLFYNPFSGMITVPGPVQLSSVIYHTGAALSFFSAAPATKPSVTGTTADEKIDSLLTALATLGLLTDSTT